MAASPARVIRLLIVDHSPTARERIRRLFDAVPDIDVVGEAGTIEKALGLLEQSSPNAVLVDCDLPAPGSFTAVWEMMSLHPVPVIMMTRQVEPPDSTLESRTLRVGAVALFVWGSEEQGTNRARDNDLIRTVRAMSEIKVVKRVDRRSIPRSPAPRAAATNVSLTPNSRIEIVAIGASTGGPPVLQTILRGLPKPLPVPILLVQHLSNGFQSGLVTWLTESTGFRVAVGKHGMPLDPDTVYLGPGNRHMTVDASGRLVLNDGPPENGSRPSISVLFRSVAECYGPSAIGILLTGMGMDGAKELRLMRDRGAVTIAQNEATSLVYGMPGEAVKLKGAGYVLPPERIAAVVDSHLPSWSYPARVSQGCQ